MRSARARRVAKDVLSADILSAVARIMMRGTVRRWVAAGGKVDGFAASNVLCPSNHV